MNSKKEFRVFQNPANSWFSAPICQVLLQKNLTDFRGEHVKADVPPATCDRLLRLGARSRKTWLGPDPARARVVEGAIGYDKTWRLFVNVRREELHGSAGLGRRKAVRKDS